MTIILQESLRGLFYAPYYAALALGAYEKEGVAVRFAAAPGFGNAPNGLFDGSTDAAWGGPMRVNQLYQERGDCDVVCFGEAVTRDPFLLVGRAPCPGFAMAELMREGKEIATNSGSPTTVYLSIALVYLAMTLPLTWLVRRLEIRWAPVSRPGGAN